MANLLAQYGKLTLANMNVIPYLIILVIYITMIHACDGANLKFICLHIWHYKPLYILLSILRGITLQSAPCHQQRGPIPLPGLQYYNKLRHQHVMPLKCGMMMSV